MSSVPPLQEMLFEAVSHGKFRIGSLNTERQYRIQRWSRTALPCLDHYPLDSALSEFEEEFFALSVHRLNLSDAMWMALFASLDVSGRHGRARPRVSNHPRSKPPRSSHEHLRNVHYALHPPLAWPPPKRTHWSTEPTLTSRIPPHQTTQTSG